VDLEERKITFETITNRMENKNGRKSSMAERKHMISGWIRTNMPLEGADDARWTMLHR